MAIEKVRAELKTQVAIIGGGPGGAASAMFLARGGIQSVIIEKEPFPRYHIGESMSGECGGVLRRLGLEAEMIKRNYPVKHGLTVYGTGGKNAWYVPVMQRTDDWQLKDQSTWQVRRSDFDQMMLEQAVARGTTLLHGQATRPLLDDEGAVRGVEVRMADGGIQRIESELVLDCSGQVTFLANAGVTGPKYRGSYDKQIAIFSQVAGAVRDPGGSREKHPGNTLIMYKAKYHWAWFIPIDEEITCVGVVIPSAYFLGKKESKPDFLSRELAELNPELTRRIPDPRLVEEVKVIPNYSYQVKRFCGKGYVCVGDAHRFIDPIFSFGLYVAVKEPEILTPYIVDYLNGVARDQGNPFAAYQLHMEKGIDILEDMMDTFWEHPLAFAAFMHVRHFPEMIDIFAGRLYERQPSTALLAMRRLLKRERPYTMPGESGHTMEDDYSVPIGSRYHPERAPLWEVTSQVESTEEWMGPR